MDTFNWQNNPYLSGSYAMPRINMNPFNWVQGEAGARAYNVVPGQTVILWDSESPTIYIKNADTNGKPSMRVLDFTERKIQNEGEKEGLYATKDDLRDLEKRIAALINKEAQNG